MQICTLVCSVLASLLIATQASLPAAHGQDYPTRPITMVVPFASGGAGDILSRMLGPRLEQRLGKPIIVENKTGAGGVIGANMVAKAPPDGYTLLIAPSGTMAVNVTLYKNLSYDPAADFVPLALVAQTPFVLVVNPESAGEIGTGADPIREGKTETAVICDCRPGRAASLVCRALEDHDRHRDVAGCLSWQPAGAQ